MLDTLHKAIAPKSAALAGLTAVFFAIVSLADITFALWLVGRGQRPAKA